MWELGYPTRIESGSSTLRGELGASVFSGFVCVAPLQLGGLKGKKSTPSVGWEVPMTSSWLESEEIDIARSWEGTFRIQFIGYGILFVLYCKRFEL